VLDGRPYRFADQVRLLVLWPQEPGQLLPHSNATGIRRLREAARSTAAAQPDSLTIRPDSLTIGSRAPR